MKEWKYYVMNVVTNHVAWVGNDREDAFEIKESMEEVTNEGYLVLENITKGV